MKGGSEPINSAACHNEAPERHRNRVLQYRLDGSRDRCERAGVAVEEHGKPKRRR